jgi:hypothetical protein
LPLNDKYVHKVIEVTPTVALTFPSTHGAATVPCIIGKNGDTISTHQRTIFQAIIDICPKAIFLILIWPTLPCFDTKLLSSLCDFLVVFTIDKYIPNTFFREQQNRDEM